MAASHMFDRAGCYVSIACLLLWLLMVASANAAFERELTYSGILEEHSEAPDEASSILTLNLRDNQFWSNFRNVYELEFAYLYDHENSEDNEQFEGLYDGSYLIVPAALSWDIGVNFEVLPEATGDEIDNFRSQNLTILRTGPRIQMLRRLPGTTEVSISAIKVDYSESLLDSDTRNIQASHRRPLTKSRTLSIILDHSSTEFEDSVNSVNDYDSDSIELVFESKIASHDFTARVASITLEHDSDPPDQEELDLNYNYRINPRSSLEFDYREVLQTSAEFNEENPTESNSLFVSSLLKTETVSLSYAYVLDRNVFEFSLYRSDVEDIFSEGVPAEISGVVASYTFVFGQNWRYFAELDVSNNDLLDDRFESFETSLTYSLEHTRDTSSEFELAAEIDESDTTSIEDNIFTYRLVSRIFR